MTYSKARAILKHWAKMGDRTGRVNLAKLIVGRKGQVWLEERSGNIAVRLYHTDVVLFTPHYIELRTGGWPTKTTCEAINAYSPVQVASDGRSGLIVRLHGEDWQSGGHPFFEGIRISPDGARVMRSQPHKPTEHEPVLLESGYTGEPIVGSRAR
jgi:hypothetical protein